MIRPARRKSGTSVASHRALLTGRAEHLAVLLVEHPKVQDLYESWGYKPLGPRQSSTDSPAYTMMLRQLSCERPHVTGSCVVFVRSGTQERRQG